MLIVLIKNNLLEILKKIYKQLIKILTQKIQIIQIVGTVIMVNLIQMDKLMEQEDIYGKMDQFTKASIRIINFMDLEDILTKMELGIILECINLIKDMEMENQLKQKKEDKSKEVIGKKEYLLNK